MSEPAQSELRITVLKFLEVAHKENGEIISKFMYEKGPFTLRIDQNGQATLSGKSGLFIFSVSDEIKSVGAGFKFAGISFSGNKNGNLHYIATFGLSKYKKTVTGIIDIERFVKSCSGLLCKTVRAIEKRYENID